MSSNYLFSPLALGVWAADQFTFQAGEEALGHRVVAGIAHCSHGGAHLHLHPHMQISLVKDVLAMAW